MKAQSKPDVTPFFGTIPTNNYTGSSSVWYGKFSFSTSICNSDKASSTVKVYPNPSSSMVYFEINNQLKQSQQIHIFSYAGQLVETLLLHKGEQGIVLNVNTYSPGIYFYRIGSASGKIVVQ